MNVNLVLCAALCFSMSVAGLCAVAAEPRGILHYAAKHGAGMNMDIPRTPLQKSDVERWGRLLNASEAQLQYMMAEYGRFVDRHNAFMDEEAPKYLAFGQEVAEIALAEGIFSRAFTEPARKLDRETIRFRNRLIALENSYIDMIEPILTAGQAERVHLIRHDARRRNCRTFRSFMRWIDVELREIWMRRAAELASPEEAAEVEMILTDYEPRLTALICRRSDLHFRIRSQLTANRIARQEGTVSAVDARSRYKRIMRGRLEADRAVRLLNERTLDRIAWALSEDARAALLNDAMQAAFPEIYPDQTQLHEVLMRVADDDELSAELQLTVSRWRDAYAAEHARLCDELEKVCVEWGDRNSEGASGYQIQYLPDALKPLLDKRTDLSRRYLEKLHEWLGPEVIARHADAIPTALRSEVEEALAD